QAHLAYDIFLDAYAKSAVLDSDSSAIQRLLWASTSTKNENYDDLLYVTNLIAPITINTLPEETIEHILDHLPDAAHGLTLDDIDEALKTVEALRSVGIDFDDVAATLEREGIEKFTASFDSLLHAIENKKQV
ncbi:MAG TPA: transaldolase family protein, partial [Candidatus Saccharibacteria bacterium]|nr:transaldolase family protein [Candidatus Saccharibacteria bacterium]